MLKKIFLAAVFILGILFLILAVKNKNSEPPVVDRETKISESIVKINPQTDVYPPELSAVGRKEYNAPVLLQGAINTRGAEDSPFITPDGNSLYFFFTPDPNIPAEKQVGDEVTGIYVSKKVNGEWQKAERVVLQDRNKLSMDGCEFVTDNVIWFCSAREGYTGLHWFTAQYKNGKWKNWKIAPEEFEKYQVGELHFSADGKELYFHSDRPGGKGQYDIWVGKMENGKLQEPVNLTVLNSEDSDGWPFISQDGNELWFTRTYKGSPSVWRSKKADGSWQTPELIISQFAGEPTLDNESNLYFVHHYYKDSKMLEADIYFMERR
jgi:hypothetical protein